MPWKRDIQSGAFFKTKIMPCVQAVYEKWELGALEKADQSLISNRLWCTLT